MTVDQLDATSERRLLPSSVRLQQEEPREELCAVTRKDDGHESGQHVRAWVAPLTRPSSTCLSKS